MLQLLLAIIFAVSAAQMNCIDSTDYWYDISKDLKLRNMIYNPKLIESGIVVPASEYLNVFTNMHGIIYCPFNNGTNVKQIKELKFACSFYKDQECKQYEGAISVTFFLEPTNNSSVTLLRKARVRITDGFYHNPNESFFNTNYEYIPILSLLSQAVKTPYLLTYVTDPINESLVHPMMIEMPTEEQQNQYYYIYKNTDNFASYAFKKFGSPLYGNHSNATFHRTGVNNLIKHYQLK